MAQRRGIFGRFSDGFRDGYDRHGPSRRRPSAPQNWCHYRGHRRRTRSNVLRIIYGVVGLILLLCLCGSCVL